MTFRMGKDTEVLLDGVDISTYCDSAEISVDVDTAETSAFKSSWKSHIPGQSSGTVDIGGMYDTDHRPYDDLVAQLGSVLSLGIGGYAAGDAARLVSVLKTSYKESAPVGDKVAFSMSILASGTVGFGNYLVPLTTFAADADGAALTGPVGGSATGAVAHLHCTSISAGETVDVTIEDDTVATFDGTPATIGTFTQVTAASAERITIAGAVRRYVRAVIDITDDGGTVAVELAVTFART